MTLNMWYALLRLLQDKLDSQQKPWERSYWQWKISRILTLKTKFVKSMHSTEWSTTCSSHLQLQGFSTKWLKTKLLNSGPTSLYVFWCLGLLTRVKTARRALCSTVTLMSTSHLEQQKSCFRSHRKIGEIKGFCIAQSCKSTRTSYQIC